jgi:hypothetical protein
MTSFDVLLRRQAIALADALEALEEANPTSERLIEAKAEPGQPQDYMTPVLIAEVAERLLRHERAINHLDVHITASQDQEIARLRSRVEELEKASASAAKSAAKKKGSNK